MLKELYELTDVTAYHRGADSENAPECVIKTAMITAVIFNNPLFISLVKFLTM